MGPMSRHGVTRRSLILVGSSHWQRWVELAAPYRSNSIRVGCRTTDFGPSSLVGEVMAYQDVAGPLSVKYSVTPADGLRWCVPRDTPQRSIAPEATPEQQTDRWNHAGRDDASGWASFGRCAQIGARRQLRGPVTFASGCRTTVFEPIVPPSLGTAARARFGLGLSFPREGAGRDRRSEGNLLNRCAVCQNHACRGAGRRAGSSLGKMRWRLLQRTGGDSRPATPSARVPPVVVYDIVTCLLRGAASGVVVAGGNSSTASVRRESRLSWRLDACRSPFGGGGRIRSPGACSRAATSCENQKICACRGLDAANGSLGNRRNSSRRLESFSSAATPRATIRRSQRQRATSPYGRSGVLTPPSGTRSKRWSWRSVPSLGRCDATPCAPDKPAVPLLGGRVEALRSDGTQLRRRRRRDPPGSVSPPDSNGPMDSVEGPGSPRSQLYHSTRRTREGGAVSAG